MNILIAALLSILIFVTTFSSHMSVTEIIQDLFFICSSSFDHGMENIAKENESSSKEVMVFICYL